MTVAVSDCRTVYDANGELQWDIYICRVFLGSGNKL